MLLPASIHCIYASTNNTRQTALCVWDRPACHPSGVGPLSINTYFAGCVISVFSEGISTKLRTVIYHVSENRCKGFSVWGHGFRSLPSCLINAQPLPAHCPATDDNPLLGCTRTWPDRWLVAAQCPFRCSFGCILLLNQMFEFENNVWQYHSDLSDQSAREIRVSI